MSGFGGLLSIDLGTQAAASAFLNHLTLFTQAVSLGDVESLSCHPGSTTHHLLGEEALRRQGVTPGLVRLSVGIEDPATSWTTSWARWSTSGPGSSSPAEARR